MSVSSEPPTPRPHLLVLDDAAVVRRALARRFGAAGLGSTTASRNEEALTHLLKATKGEARVDALVQDHERPVGGDGTRMLKVMRGMYGDRTIANTGLTLRAVPVLVLSGEPHACEPALHKVDRSVRVLAKATGPEALLLELVNMWNGLKQRILAATTEVGVHVVRTPHGWVVDAPSGVETALFRGTGEQLESTLTRLEEVCELAFPEANAAR